VPEGPVRQEWGEFPEIRESTVWAVLVEGAEWAARIPKALEVGAMSTAKAVEAARSNQKASVRKRVDFRLALGWKDLRYFPSVWTPL